MADDILKEARDIFELMGNVESENRTQFLEDIKFARLGEQWPSEVETQRAQEGRPCLTINKLPAFRRQVTNDMRQNKPGTKARPVDDNADPETAEVYTGLIRNIEVVSNADVAYQTAGEFAIDGGWGYWRIGIEYACDDTFDKDILIQAIPDPLSVYGDPYSKCADSSDWNDCFVVEELPKAVFERQYKGAAGVNWNDYQGLSAQWVSENTVVLGEWWHREEVMREILLLSNGAVLDVDVFAANKDFLLAVDPSLAVTANRAVKSYKVTQKLMTGAEVLEENDWAGKYIPIVPVYGEVVVVEGKRHLRSLIRDAKDPQRMYNYWRTCQTELVALAPKAPFIGPEGAFVTDADKWENINNATIPYVQYDGPVAPQRQPFMGVPAGAVQEALSANDDMKSILGIYDASLGARSNETSGKAIMARQREGDVSTFHFLDNLARAITHSGRILLDLIPHVYSGARMIRILGADGGAQNVPLGKPVKIMGKGQYAPASPEEHENPAIPTAVFDLTAGRYDLVVETGPSYTTKRQEAAEQMIELIRAFPQAAPMVGDLLAKNLDWPGADEIAERLKAMLPPQVQGQDPRIAQGMKVIQELKAKLEKAEAANDLELRKLMIDAYNAETNRLKVTLPAAPQFAGPVAGQDAMNALASPDVLPMGAPPRPQMPPGPMPHMQGPPPNMPMPGMPPQQQPAPQKAGFFMPTNPPGVGPAQ